MASSFEGEGTLSLNRSSDAATLRPIPAVEVEGVARAGGSGDEDMDEGGEDVRDRGRMGLGEDMARRSSDLYVLAAEDVTARSDALLNLCLRGERKGDARP